jgi:3-hydroxyisobutyrate dehydrogenase-like beta-hydroxyacid dehydrogenase
MNEQIGFIGLGNMGLPMAANLLSAGFPLRVFNRTTEKTRPLAEKGAVVVKDPAAVASPGGIVITMLSDDIALQLVAPVIERAIGRGGVHLSMSTVAPPTNEFLAASAAKHDVAVVAAPVFGRPEAATAKKLWICVSGDEQAKRRVRPILDALGQGVFDFGRDVSAANVVKLAGNFLIIAAIEAMAEASALAEKHGINRADLLNMLTQTLFNCPLYNNYAKLLIGADFKKVAFKAELAFKDMNLARHAAVDKRVPMPILNVLCDGYLAAIANGRGTEDATVIAAMAAQNAGLRWG